MFSNSAVIVSTFNRPDAMSVVLHSLSLQSEMTFQVVVADDGSNPETSNLIRSIRDSYPYSIKHVWIPNVGFRAARVRNIAALAAEADHLIFIDGDCLVPRRFVEMHRRLLVNWRDLVTGGRQMLSAEKTKSILAGKIGLRDAFRGWKFLIFPLGYLRHLFSNHWSSVRTCNVSMHRRLFYLIGGFDEEYKGWGLEDSDLAIRALRAGGKVTSGRFAATVAHLDHGVTSTTEESPNNRLFHKLLVDKSRILGHRSIWLESK